MFSFQFFFPLLSFPSPSSLSVPQSGSSRGILQLEGCSCEIVPESKYGLSACFELNSPLQGRIFALSCDTQEMMQGWINVIRSTMLKIRRTKAKEAAARKRAAVEGAAQESQQAQKEHREAQQAMANAAAAQGQTTHSSSSSSAALANSYNPPSSLAASDSSAYSASAASSSSGAAATPVQPNQNGAYNSSTGAGGLPQSSEDKYTGQNRRNHMERDTAWGSTRFSNATPDTKHLSLYLSLSPSLILLSQFIVSGWMRRRQTRRRVPPVVAVV